MTRRTFIIILVIALITGFYIFLRDDIRVRFMEEEEPSASMDSNPAPTPTIVPADTPVPAPTHTPVPTPIVFIEPRRICPGDYTVVHITGIQQGDHNINIRSDLWADEIPCFLTQSGYISLVPADYRTTPGEYTVQVEMSYPVPFKKTFDLTVTEKAFPEERFTVTEEQKSTRSSDNWKKDGVHTARARSITMPKPRWEGPFIIPVEGPITSEFGVIRYINNELSGRHSGIDISAVTGTPVKAANSGRVNLAMELVITGNTIIIDHGANLYSSYCHLDKLIVSEGDVVKKGDIIGEVGSTGFSTGAHLHWSISIGSTFVNPWLFMQEDPLSRLQ